MRNERQAGTLIYWTTYYVCQNGHRFNDQLSLDDIHRSYTWLMKTDLLEQTEIFYLLAKLLRERRLVEIVQFIRAQNDSEKTKLPLWEIMALLLMPQLELQKKGIERFMGINLCDLHSELLPQTFIDYLQNSQSMSTENSLLSICQRTMKWLTRYEWKNFQQTDISKRFQLLVLFELEILAVQKNARRPEYNNFKNLKSFNLLPISEQMARYGLASFNLSHWVLGFKFFLLSYSFDSRNPIGLFLGHRLFNYFYSIKSGYSEQLIKLRRFPYWRSIGTVQVLEGDTVVGELSKEFLGVSLDRKYSSSLIYEIELNEVIPVAPVSNAT